MLRARLRTRILVWLFVPTTIILFAVAFTNYYAYQRVTEDLVVGRNQQLIHLSAGQLAADLNAYVNTLTALAHSADVYTGNPTQQSSALMRASNQLQVFDGGVLVLDPMGKIVSTEPYQPDLIGQDWSNRSFFRQILHTEVPTFSDIIPSGPQTPAVLAVAVPILNNQSAFQGTLVGTFRLGAGSSSAFYGGIIKLRLGESGNIYLVDSTGRVIYHPDDSQIGRDLHDQADVQQVLKGQVGYLRTRNPDGQDILATFAPVPGTPWGLINEESWPSLLASSRGYGQFLYLLLGLGVVIPTLVVLFGVKRITDPVAQLMAAAQEIAAGKYGQQISVHTGDELEELGEQFNLMSVQLQESYAQLEQRVAARTHDLATLNAVAEVVSRSLDLKEVMQDALERIMDVTDMAVGSALLLDETTQEMVLIAYRGQLNLSVQPGARWPLVSALAGKSLEGAHPLTWNVATDYPDGALKSNLMSEGVQLVVGVPLIAKEKMVGMLVLNTRAPREITPEESSLLEAIGRQVGIAVENARLYEQAERTAAVSERNRLARELHDSVTQLIYSVTLYAEAAAELLGSGDTVTAADHLRELRDTAQEALREMRLLIFELRRPALEKSGLAGAIQARLDAVESRGGMQAELHLEGVEALSHLAQEELYNIAQEALNNALKHAHAKHVQIRLQFGESGTSMEVSDDGVGFEPTQDRLGGGFGISGMKERVQKLGGTIDIVTSPGNGTTVRVWVPASSSEKPLLSDPADHSIGIEE